MERDDDMYADSVVCECSWDELEGRASVSAGGLRERLGGQFSATMKVHLPCRGELLSALKQRRELKRMDARSAMLSAGNLELTCAVALDPKLDTSLPSVQLLEESLT